MPRHITELEFWSSKQPDVKAVTSKGGGGQRAGLPTALLNLMSAPRDPQTGKINVKISQARQQRLCFVLCSLL